MKSKQVAKTLTPKQMQFLEAIEAFRIQNGYFPSQPELMKILDLKSLGSIQSYLRILEDKGFLQKDAHSKRELKLNLPKTFFDDQAETQTLPLLGKVAAGRPIDAVESGRVVSVPRSMIKGGFDHFVLKVSGNSMVEDLISDGDFVVIRKQETANNGQTVVALINNEATIKIFYKRKNLIELVPANSRMKSIIVEPHQEFRIAGVLAGLIRNYN